MSAQINVVLCTTLKGQKPVTMLIYDSHICLCEYDNV